MATLSSGLANQESITFADAGRHVERECAEPVGAPVTAHVWTYATTKPDKNGHVPVDFAAIKTVCDKDDKTMCEGWLGSYTFYTQQQSGAAPQPASPGPCCTSPPRALPARARTGFLTKDVSSTDGSQILKLNLIIFV